MIHLDTIDIAVQHAKSAQTLGTYRDGVGKVGVASGNTPSRPPLATASVLFLWSLAIAEARFAVSQDFALRSSAQIWSPSMELLLFGSNAKARGPSGAWLVMVTTRVSCQNMFRVCWLPRAFGTGLFCCWVCEELRIQV
eukprot:3410356-Amphidinium_carterae.1